MDDLLSLSGRTVLVTGAGQGVGRRVALHCADHGATVVVNDFHPERAEAPGVATATENVDLVKSMLRSYVIRRLGEPDDAANLILFLASDAAAWITGPTYPVNGGYSFAV